MLGVCVHRLIAPPLYVMLCSSLDKAEGIKVLTDAIAIMKEEINKAKGELQVERRPHIRHRTISALVFVRGVMPCSPRSQVKSPPRAVDERDDKLLSNLMSSLEQQNQEVDGDADEEEVEGMGSANIDGM